MRKRKVKPNTFEDRAIAKVQQTGKIDLAELWKAEEDKEADPVVIEALAKG
jgi:hypothetical protein